MTRAPLTTVAFVLTALAPRAASAQCAMCRLALQSPEGQHLAAALRSGIVVLLIAPVLCFGIVAFLALRLQRRDRVPDRG